MATQMELGIFWWEIAWSNRVLWSKTIESFVRTRAKTSVHHKQNGRLVTEVRRHVTMVAKFLDHNNRELKQGEQLKSNNVI